MTSVNRMLGQSLLTFIAQDQALSALNLNPNGHPFMVVLTGDSAEVVSLDQPTPTESTSGSSGRTKSPKVSA